MIKQNKLVSTIDSRFGLMCSFPFTPITDGAFWVAMNNGFGPARIKWFTFKVDNQEMPNWDAALDKLMISGPRPFLFKFEHAVFYPGTIVPAGLSRTFLPSRDTRSADILVKTYPRIQIEACFCSFYDECWRAHSHTLDLGLNDKNCAEGKPKVVFGGSELRLPSELQNLKSQWSP